MKKGPQSCDDNNTTNNTNTNICDDDDGIVMVEFFSGIGGMRLGVERALKRRRHLLAHRWRWWGEVEEEGSSTTSASASASAVPLRLDSCQAYEISLHANAVYRHNFDNHNKHHHHYYYNKEKEEEEKLTSGRLYTKLVEQLQPETLSLSSKNKKKNGPCHCQQQQQQEEQEQEKDGDGSKDYGNKNNTLWTMSPPCQPFTTTRGGKLLDCDDKRCNGLKGILRLLTQLDEDQKPKWIFLENVKGFYQSRMLDQVYQCLRQNGYSWQEYLISPIHLGIPNHRLRYYLLCQRRSSSSSSHRFASNGSSNNTNHSILQTTLPESYSSWSLGNNTNTPNDQEQQHEQRPQPLSEFLQPLTLEESRPYLIPDTALQQEWAKHLSIVTGSSTQTYCFTAAYSRVLHRATGSLVLVNHHHDHDHATTEIVHDNNNEAANSTSTKTNLSSSSLKNCNSGGDNNNDNDFDDGKTNERKPHELALQPTISTTNGSDMMQYSNKVRRFTPRELLNLFGFPPDFDFPPNDNNDDAVSLEHQYKLVGNSVNVEVVSVLIYELLFPSKAKTQNISMSSR